MLVHRRVTPSIKFPGTHLYTWVERGTVRVKCLAQEHNTMSPARARTRSARSGVERTNHEATGGRGRVDKNSLRLQCLGFLLSRTIVLWEQGQSGLTVSELDFTSSSVSKLEPMVRVSALGSWARHLTLTLSLSLST